MCWAIARVRCPTARRYAHKAGRLIWTAQGSNLVRTHFRTDVPYGDLELREPIISVQELIGVGEQHIHRHIFGPGNVPDQPRDGVVAPAWDLPQLLIG
jgi:hypothetical protein